MDTSASRVVAGNCRLDREYKQGVYQERLLMDLTKARMLPAGKFTGNCWPNEMENLRISHSLGILDNSI
jgi:hypothetical protein